MIDFKNIIEVTEYFSSHDNCINYLYDLRFKDGLYCPHCGAVKVYKFKDGRTYKCGEKECNKKFNVFSKTIFENTKIPLQKWYIAIYILSAHKKGISSLQLARDLGVTQKTAWFINHRVRAMLFNKEPHLLEGSFEIDETYVGGKRGNKHKWQREKTNAGGTAEKTPVLTMLHRDTKQVHNFVVVRTDSDTLKPIIFGAINDKSVVITDNYPSYKGLNQVYKHETVNHAAEEYVRGEFHTNTVEGYFSLLKRGIIGIYHYVSPKHLHRYCDEFGYRYNTKKLSDVLRFRETVSRVGNARLKYNELIKDK